MDNKGFVTWVTIIYGLVTVDEVATHVTNFVLIEYLIKKKQINFTRLYFSLQNIIFNNLLEHCSVFTLSFCEIYQL